MQRHEEPFSDNDTDFSQVRVRTEDLTRALAEIDARKARQAFEQAGTLTLAEALQECDTEATPEELAMEVRKVREADALATEKQKHRRRLRLILQAELASVLLCGLTLLSLSRTIYNPQWQASRQVDVTTNILQLTQGPNPQYQIFVIPTAFRNTMTIGTPAINSGIWSASPAYPLSFLPDGYNIHHYDELNDDGQTSFMEGPFVRTSPAYFEFRPIQSQPMHEIVSVYYNGICYRRGWIKRSDIPNLLHGGPFLFYPEPVDDPQDHHKGLAPLTLANQSIKEATFEPRFANNTGYGFLAFKGGTPVQLDEHAWKAY